MFVAVDTNSLIYSVRNKIDILAQLRSNFGPSAIYIPDRVIKELKNLVENAKKDADKEAAKVALQLIKQRQFPIVEIGEEGHTDDLLLAWAVKNKAAVMTNDVQFRFRLKESGVRVLYFMQGKIAE